MPNANNNDLGTGWRENIATMDANNERIDKFHDEALSILEEKENTHFPAGTEVAKIPLHVKNSWKYVQTLPQEKQAKISYYEKDGQWFIKLNKIKISLQHEIVENTPDQVKNVSGRSYFSQSQAEGQAHKKGLSLPTNTHWREMITFLGSYENLRKILQIDYDGYLDSDYKLVESGRAGMLWSKDRGNYLAVYWRDSRDVGKYNYRTWEKSDEIGSSESVLPLSFSVRLLDS